MSVATNRSIAKAVANELEAGRAVEDVAKALAAYLITERRSKDMSAIVRDVERQLFIDKGHLEVHVTSARPIDDVMRKAIIDLFKTEAKNVIINERQNPFVLGGVLVESSENRLDLTVRRQIQQLKSSGV